MADNGDDLNIEDVKVHEAAASATAETGRDSQAANVASDGQAQAPPEPLPEWAKLPKEKDGWFMSHEAIRLDMSDFVRCLDALSGDRDTAPWMGENVEVWFNNFYKSVHEHHDHEEAIFFPEMSKRVTVPPKMTADHKQLMQALDDCKSKTAELCKLMKDGASKEAVKASVEAIKLAFIPMQESMREHLQEEEHIGLPLFRAHFTIKDTKKLEARIIKTMDNLSMGWFMRPLDDAAKMDWMKNVAGMPYPVRNWLFWPLVKKGGRYDMKFTQPLEDVVNGTQSPKPKPAKCAIM